MNITFIHYSFKKKIYKYEQTIFYIKERERKKRMLAELKYKIQ